MLSYIISGLISLLTPWMMQTVSSPARQNEKALAELNLILTHRPKFIKVHAAEYLIWTGHTREPLKEFLQQEALFHTEPKYRVVIWRVLQQADPDANRKKKWLNNIYDAYKNMQGPDRTHAAEALAKLKQPVGNLFPQVTKKTMASADRNLATYALWADSYGSETRMAANREKILNQALTDTNTIIRRISAYILRKEQGLTQQQWQRVETVALNTNKTNELYVALLATALVTAPKGVSSQKLAQIDALLTAGTAHYSVSNRTELALALAEKGTPKHLGLLMGFLNNKDSVGIYDPSSDEGADLRAAAAYAILKINSRNR